MFSPSHQSSRLSLVVFSWLTLTTGAVIALAEEPAAQALKSSEVVEHVLTGRIDITARDGTPLPDLRGLAEQTLGVPATGQGTARLVGSDNRVKVSSTTQTPWAPQCYLLITANNGQTYRASGVLIGPKTVLTNGITVYNKNTGGWVRGIKVYPGRNGSSSPYGYANAVAMKTFTGWTQSSNTSDNIGVIILDSPIGNKAGWYGVKSTNDSYLTNSNKAFYAYGYPTGKSPDYSLWGMKGRVTGLADSGKQIKIDHDVTGGQFGCPLFSDDREDGYWLVDPGWMPYVVGVIVTESSSSSAAYNVAARITSDKLTTIKSWIQ